MRVEPHSSSPLVMSNHPPARNFARQRTTDPNARAVSEAERQERVAAGPAAAPKQPPTWEDVLAMPEMASLSPVELEQARGQYFVDVVAPVVPALEIKAAKAAFDADTKAATRAAGRHVPTWDEVSELPEMQALSAEEFEQARNQYFVDVVQPLVPRLQRRAARAAFDRDTKPGLLDRAARKLEGAVRAMGNRADVEPTADELARAAQPVRMTMTRSGRRVLQQPDQAPDYGQRADGTPKGLGYFGELKRPDGGVSTELSIGVNLNGQEVEIPGLVPTLSRAEVGHLLKGGEPTPEIIDKAVQFARERIAAGKSPFAAEGERRPLPDEPSAPWGEVVSSLPAQFVAGGRSAVANLRRMVAEESISAREEALKPASSDASGWGALVKPKAIERQRRKLEEDRAALSEAIADAAQATSDVRLVTPPNMKTTQQALSSLAQSAGPTLLGLAAGILTRNVPLAMAIAGGGGAAQQAGATYGEARDEHGATHRQASLAATIDAALEGGGEMLPLSFALKPGTAIFKRIFGTIAREAGQETATQLAQDLRQRAMENPKLTVGEVWHNMKVAALAGAGGGAVYGGAGAAANAAREREARAAVERATATQAGAEVSTPTPPVAAAPAGAPEATSAPRPAEPATADAVIPEDAKDLLRVMAANSGHLERGGQVIREPADTQTGGDVVGVTKWVGQPAWAKGLGATPAEVQTAVEKAIAGKSLGPKQRGIVKAMLAEVAATRANLGQAVARSSQGADRRTDAATRARVAEMTPEQMRRELLTSHFGGIGNRRAYDEATRKPVQVAIDADSLKWINDNLGHDAGDELLRAIGESLATVAPQDGFHISGDEFVLQAEDDASAERVLAALGEEIWQREITYEAPDGRIFTYVPRISHGQGPTLREADTALARAKTEREAAGARAGRGERPVGLVEATPLGWEAKDRSAAEVAERGRAARGPAPGPAATEIGTRERPAEAQTGADVRAADAQVEAEPTAAQKDAENFRMGHLRWQGLDISIETPKGGTRTAKDGSWSVPNFPASYGRFKGTTGKDGDHVDVFVGSDPGAKRVYIVDQVDPETGKFDEHKVFVGYMIRDRAVATYDRAFSDGSGPSRRGAVSALSIDEFKTWLERGGGSKGPFAASAVKARARSAAVAARSIQSGAQVPEATRRGRDDDAVIPPSVPPQVQRDGRADDTEAGELPAVGIVMTPPYTGTADTEVADKRGARPDAIRQAIRDLFRVPLNEGRFRRSRDTLGLYKSKPRTIRVRNQNDIAVIAHELGHHISESSRPIREARRAFDTELRRITPYAAQQKGAALQREEGMAEFVKLYLMQPAQAKAKAPGFFKAFDEYVAKHGMKPAVDQIAGAIRDWQNLPPAERILAKVGEGERDFRERFNLDRVIFEVFDRWLPMRRMVEDLKPDVAASADPFKLAHLLAGDAAIIENWLLRETVPFDFQRRANPDDRGKPLAEILKPVRDQQREFGAYLIAKRANELMRRGKEHLYSRDEIAAGLRLETPEFKAAAEQLYLYQEQLLDHAVEGGLLSERAADAFRQHPFYVPFFRVGEPIARRGGNIFKEILGGTENLRDPIANIIENTVRVIHATNRNYVLAKAHDLARSVPGGGRWLEDVPMPERAVKLETQKIIEQLREQGVEIDTEAAEALATSQTFFVKNPFGDDRDRVIVIRRQGRAHALQVNDEMLWRALERFEPVDMGFIETLLAVPADVLRAGIVLSPEFMARNFARDTLSGFLQSKKGLVPVASTLGGFKEIVTRSDAARLYRAFGGGFADMWRADRGLERKLVERMARHGGFDPRTIVTPRGLISLLHRIGSATEAGTRVAEFKKSMGQSTVDELIDAAYNAREVSVDFGMHGHSRSVRFFTRTVPFLNPALQGWYKATRTGKSAPFMTLLRGSLLTAASIWLYLANRDEDWYDELEQWERNVYWHIDIGLRDDQGRVTPLRIPKPWEWGAVFGSVPEALVEVAIEQHGKRFAERLLSIFDDVFMVRTVPTALLVPAELWANKNTFRDRPIVPESKERLEPALQATSGTSLTARKAGELAGVAPAKIDHAVRGLFGTLGTYTLMLTDQAVRGTSDEAAAPRMPWQRSPVARVFFRDPDGAYSRHVTEFYDRLRKARTAGATLRAQLEAETAREYRDRRIDELRFLGPGNQAARVMGELREKNERIARQRDLTDEEKRRAISANNARIRDLAKRLVERDEEARKARVPAGGARRDERSSLLRAIQQGLRQ